MGGSGTIEVIDGLDSDSATDALSANQGRVLNERIDYVIESILNIATDADIDAIFAA